MLNFLFRPRNRLGLELFVRKPPRRHVVSCLIPMVRVIWAMISSKRELVLTKSRRALLRERWPMKSQALRRQIRVLSESTMLTPLRVPSEKILKWLAVTRRPMWAFVLRSFCITTEWNDILGSTWFVDWFQMPIYIYI